MKPLNRKSYGSIGHLPASRMGPADHKISDGQARIATEKKRDRHDVVIVQEKLDGSNVGVAKVNGEIIPLVRSGYVANTSPYKQHHVFYDWVLSRKSKFGFLNEGERVCGEWIYQAHGTVYKLQHEPFVAFDVFDTKNNRLTYERFCEKIKNYDIVIPYLVSAGDALSIESAMQALGELGRHGAIEPIEGAVWRVERKGEVDFLCKYVRPDKIDGKYLDREVINTQ